MAFEQKLAAVSPQLFTSDGTALGVITIASTAGFYIKQKVNLQSTAYPQEILLQIKNILSDTQLIVVPNNNSLSANPKNVTDVSGYTVITNASISAPEQNNFPIPGDDHYNTVFMPAPVMADRVYPVDPYGNPYSDTNPLPVAFDGTVSIGDVHILGPAPDNNQLVVNSDGSINVIVESTPSPNTTVVNTYNQLASVASGATVNIVTYTVPVSKQSVFQKATFSGENIARYDLLINGSPQDTARTMFGGDLTGEFNFTTGNDTGLVLAAGTTISVQVYNVRPTAAAFEARIQVLETPA
jgi:hypothetical protein